MTAQPGDAGSDAAPANFDAQVSLPSADATVSQPGNCNPGNDSDGDKFTVAEGDCNDCDPVVNPGAYDFPGNDFDEDCSGSPAQGTEGDCDQGLQLASTAAQDAARALGLCKFTTASGRDWGVIEARFTNASGSGSLGSPLQVGLLPKFGAVNPRAGASLLALSSGIARAPDQPGYTRNDSDSSGSAGSKPPQGFPKGNSECPPGIIDTFLFGNGFDQAALELKIRVPTNARSLSFDSIFYTYEYPKYICQPFNDFYVGLLEPRITGDGNVVFDSKNNPIGVNTGLLAVCDPSTQNKASQIQFTCDQMTALLAGTGFGKEEYDTESTLGKNVGGASTGWLTTTAPAAPGSVITLRLAIWDQGDNDVDSTVLVDRFQWSVEQPTAPTTVATPVLQ